VDDAYEQPPSPDVCINTVDMTPEESAGQILETLIRKGFLPENGISLDRKIAQRDMKAATS
jgi:hypothetical protein